MTATTHCPSCASADVRLKVPEAPESLIYRCGNRMKETSRTLGGSPQLRCVACASLLKVDGEQVRVALATLEAAAKAMLDGGIRKIG